MKPGCRFFAASIVIKAKTFQIMKSKFLFLLVLCCLLGSSPTLRANVTDPLTSIQPPPPCTLAAPANLQYTQVTPYSINFNWDTVPGAVGYRSVLTRLSNGTQQVQQNGPQNANFVVVPGEAYHFMVAAMCSLDPPEVSSEYSEMLLTTETIVIDLIVERQGCTPSNIVPDLNASPQIWGFNWQEGVDYYIELSKPNPMNPVAPKKIMLAFKRDADGFSLGELTGDDGAGNLCGQGINMPQGDCSGPPASTFNAKVTFEGRTCRMAFPSMAEIYFYNNQLETPFSSITIYRTCTGTSPGNGNGTGGGGGGKEGGNRSDGLSGGTEMAGADLKVIAVNPFTNLLTLKFPELPEGPVKTRLIDLQGIPKIETLIQPGEMNENTYSIQTDALPAGLYFLQMETQSGQMIVRKVVKI